MNKLLKLSTILITIGLFSYLIGQGAVYNHELMHKKIFSRFNISSEISIDYKTLSGVTTPENDNCLKNDICGLEHQINDIVYYNSALIVFTLFFIFTLFMTFKIMFEKND